MPKRSAKAKAKKLPAKRRQMKLVISDPVTRKPFIEKAVATNIRAYVCSDCGKPATVWYLDKDDKETAYCADHDPLILSLTDRLGNKLKAVIGWFKGDA